MLPPPNGPPRGATTKGSTMRRHSVNKASSARKFRKGAGRTHPKNIAIHRGGYRL